MIRRMILHTLLATLLIGALAWGYQAYAQGEGLSAARIGLAGAWSGRDHDRHEDDD